MVIDDREFVEVRADVRVLKTDVSEVRLDMSEIKNDVKKLLGVYNQAVGASAVVSPFWSKFISLITFLIGAGMLYIIQQTTK